MKAPELVVAWPVNALGEVAKTLHRAAVVLLVEDVDEFRRDLLTSGHATLLARSGAKLFALVGRESEQAHDALDWVLEAAGFDAVLTTWHGEGDFEDVAVTVVSLCRGEKLTQIVACLDLATEKGRKLREVLAQTSAEWNDESGSSAASSNG